MKEKFPWIKETKTCKGEVTVDIYLIASQKSLQVSQDFYSYCFSVPQRAWCCSSWAKLITAFPRATAIGAVGFTIASEFEGLPIHCPIPTSLIPVEASCKQCWTELSPPWLLSDPSSTCNLRGSRKLAGLDIRPSEDYILAPDLSPASRTVERLWVDRTSPWEFWDPTHTGSPL